jgi:hypothetical protein
VFVDGERFLGQVTKTGHTWAAFDLTTENETGNGPIQVGTGLTLEAAKRRVEEMFEPG